MQGKENMVSHKKFNKHPSSNFADNRPVGVVLIHSIRPTDSRKKRRTKRHDKGNRHFSRLCEST